MREADLRGAILHSADLVCANLEGADLQGAGLVDADISRADLRGANLSGADTDHLTWVDVVYDDTTVWPDPNWAQDLD